MKEEVREVRDLHCALHLTEFIIAAERGIWIWNSEDPLCSKTVKH